jgi:uncharacterized protein YgiM (DUF1202 family)
MIYIAIILLSVSFSQAEMVAIPRDNTQLREGPGSFYRLVGVLNQGAKVNLLPDDQNGWRKVVFGEQQGWISENALIATVPAAKPKSGGSILSGISTTTPNFISSASASGAIKGFALKFINLKQGDPTFADQYDYYFFTPEEYYRFKSETFAGRNPEKIRKRVKKIKGEDLNNSLSIDEESVGLAAAGKIAAMGLEMDLFRLKYLNLVCALVLENTPINEYNVRVYIVKDTRPAAYTTPNGMIFLTKGLLTLVQDEAELAGLLGHEIAHIVNHHGYKELGKRATMITADKYFNELDEEIQPDEVQVELDDIALNCYEAATSRRQTGYEYEADRLGAIYAYRAGYDPEGLVRLLQRIKGASQRDFWHPESNWTYDAIGDRIEKVHDLIQRDLNKSPELNATFQIRYKTHIK